MPTPLIDDSDLAEIRIVIGRDKRIDPQYGENVETRPERTRA